MTSGILEVIQKLLFTPSYENKNATNSDTKVCPTELVRKGLNELDSKDVLWMLEQSWADFNSKKYDKGLERAQISLDYIWEKLNTGYWKDVDKRWREAYTVASLFKVLCLIGRKDKIEEVVKSCDIGLLMGAPVLENILSKIADVLQGEFKRKHEKDSLEKCVNDDKRRKFHDENSMSDDSSEPSNLSCLCSTSHQNEGFGEKTQGTCLEGYSINKTYQNTVLNRDNIIPRVASPSLHSFQNMYMSSAKPVIIQNAMSHWPAMTSRKWDTEYIKMKAGCRTVPVEIGERYTSNDWTQKLLSINEFIDKFIENWDCNEKGYLAQHQLFDQIPELRADICIPDYCCLGDASGIDDDIIINAWFGPGGTVSPLHQDPYENIFAQVVGQKYIRLYDDKYSSMVYPHDSHLLDNTSQVDVENPDLEEFPLFADAPYVECILKEGEMLYIPKKCWHFVRSLSLSFSVSFWWS